MADTAPEDEEMPDRVHVRRFLLGVEEHPDRVENTPCGKPDDAADRDAG